MSALKEKINQLGYVLKDDCVLVIGPSAYLCDTSQGKCSLFELLSEEIVKQVPDLQPFTEGKDFHLLATEFAKKKSKTALARLVTDFYQNFQGRIPFLDAIAKLPFSLIINTTPDDLLLKALQRKGKLNLQSAFYNYGKQGQNELFTKVNADNPLIYNILGSTTERNSLVLTQGEQLSFVKSIISEDAGLPKSLIAMLKEKTHYLFVGFDFEYWYLRLVFQTLGLDKRPEIAFGFHNQQDSELKLPTRLFFSNEYNIEFLEQEPLAFLELLGDEINGSATNTSVNHHQMSHQIFMMYHQNDADLFEKIKIALTPILNKNNVQVVDNHTFTGGNIEEIYQKNVSSSALILPLMSSRFLADDSLIASVELATKQADKKVVPILLKPCSFDIWEEKVSFYSVLPAKDQFLSQQADQDAALVGISNAIEIIIKNLAS